ncbi:MAG: hypothetical protein ACI93T_000123 [Porticoccaceae bacterium]
MFFPDKPARHDTVVMTPMAEYPEQSLQAAQTLSFRKPADVLPPVKGEHYEILGRGLVVPVATVRAVATPVTSPDGVIVAMFSVYRGF